MTKRPYSRTTVRPAPRYSTRLKLQALAVAGAFGSLAAGLHGNALANPAGQQVVNAQATFNAAGSTLTITNTPGAVINWQSFSIGASELTKFVQQNASSAVLNRVVGADPSSILGQLQSNGKVFLINPSGIVFGQGARIDVGGLVASTANISNADFLAGKLKFQAGAVQGNVSNQGAINAASGGTVLLIGKDVSNSGIIQAPNGQIMLAAGTTVEVIDTTTPGVKVVFTADANKAENLGTLTAQNVNMAGALLRNKGIVNANQVSRDGQGRVVFSATRSVTLESGSTITANGTAGGSITMTAGNDIKVEGNTLTQANGNAGPGGTISLKSTEGNINIDAGALIQANGASSATGAALAVPNPGQAGGFIAIQSVKGSTTVAGSLEARGNGAAAGAGVTGAAAGGATVTATGTASAAITGNADGASTATGGTVHLLGTNVALVGNATVDASGTDGGGTILVGGDYQGKNPDIQNALTTFVDRNVVLKADADLKGDGGKVVVWADNATHFVGSLNARGGTQGGNGGFAEVSGKDFLYFRPSQVSVASRIAGGVAGTLLLDPTDIEIVASDTATQDTAFSGSNPVTFQDTTTVSTSEVLVSDLSTILTGGSSVVVNTSNASGTAPNGGRILWKTGADLTPILNSGAVSLTLKAEADIVVQGGVSISAGGLNKLDLIFNSRSTNGSGGAIVIGDGSTLSSIYTNGGDIVLGGGSTPLFGYAIGSATNRAGVRIDKATLMAAGGSISINGSGIQTSGAPAPGVEISNANSILSTNSGGTISINGSGGGSGSSINNQGVVISGAFLTALDGALSISGSGGATTGSGNDGVKIAGAIVSSTGAGNVTVSGLGGGGTSPTFGVSLQASASLSAFNGNLNITGDRGASGGSGNAGVYVNNATITKSGSGNLTVLGTGGANGTDNNHGVLINTGGSINHSGASGTFTVTGVGNGSTAVDVGVNIYSSSTALSTIGANLTINGTGGTGSGNDNVGVWLTGSSATNLVKTSGAGSVTINGTGRANGTGNAGVKLSGGAGVQAASSGAISINGTGSATGTDLNVGVWVIDSGSGVTTTATNGGAISINGVGGGSGSSNIGVAVVYNGAAITSTNATNGGAINITGFGANGTSSNYGLYNYGALISSVSGAMNLSGAAGAATGNFNHGVLVSTGGTIETTGTAALTMHGVGSSAGTTQNYGVYLDNAVLNTIRTTGSGNVTINGTGGSSGTSTSGVALDTAGRITSSGSGTIAINGLGGNNDAGAYGVIFAYTGKVSSSTGNIAVTGTAGGATAQNGLFLYSGGTVESTGAAAIALTGIGGIPLWERLPAVLLAARRPLAISRWLAATSTSAALR